VIKAIKVKLGCQVFKEIKVREETVVNQEKKVSKVSLDFQEFREFKETKERKERLDLKVIKATKDSGVIKVIKVKLDHLVIKVKEAIKVKKDYQAVLGAQVSQERRD
jgi:hypothetical protein